ncbi:MAG: hypothetical protein JXR72_07230 [Proteobacteria bacterium]|nr:hypothetical protein [Pseudomonadota bacterium]
MNNTMKITLAALIALAGTAVTAQGIDLSGTARIGATVSDNINRSPSGFEEDGSILTQGIGVLASQGRGRRTFLLTLDGGWETLESESESSSEQVYRMDLELGLPLSRTGRLEATAGASRETSTPEPGDPVQERTLVKRSRAGLLVGNDPSAVARWEAGVDGSREEREDADDIREITGRVFWSRDLSRVRTLSLEGTGLRGSDDIDETSWRDFSAEMELSDRLSPSFTRTLTLDWEKRVFEDEEGVEGDSWMAGVEAGYESRREGGLSHSGTLGISRMTQTSGEDTWEPRASFSVEKALSRTTTADAGIEFRTLMQDPREDELERTRQRSASAGLMWAASRQFSVGPRVSYLFEDIIGRTVADREDETIIARIDARWTPYTTWLMEMGFVAEKQESTDPSEELTERRIEVRASSIFR